MSSCIPDNNNGGNIHAMSGHHNSHLHCRWYEKIRAAVSSPSRSHRSHRSQPSCSRVYSSLSTPAIGLHVDADSNLDSEHEHEKYVSIMGKSNKFDYSNRPNSGSKLGQIVGRDLEKEADRVKKDADRLASKARKVSTGSGSSTVSSTDTRDGIIHTLDIKLPGKQLGDDGASAMFHGLESALRRGTSEASVLLEDLNLANNAVTTHALARLAPIVNLARHDLKTLDLSQNNIKVETVEEVEEWEKFLRAFKRCLKLRRLDLSGNSKLGPKALETFTRVYIAEEDMTPVPAGGMASVHSLTEYFDQVNQKTPRASTSPDPMAHGTILHRRSGLKSTPYIALNDVGLTDAGALWLSYVIEDHYYPNQLTHELNATHADSNIKMYQQSTQSSGIQWNKAEHGLSRDGKSLLEKAERIRRQIMLADQVTTASWELSDDEGTDVENEEVEFPTTRSLDYRHSRTAKGDRRASIRSIHTNDGGEHEVSELESARKKVQRSVLQQHGASSVELWCASLRIAIAAQVLSGLGPAHRQPHLFYTGPPMFDFGASRTAGVKKQPSLPVTPINKGKNIRKSSTDSRPTSSDGPRRQGTYAATLTASTGATVGEPELAITEVTNSPTTPKMIFKPHRKGAFSDGGDLQTQKLDALVFRDVPHEDVAQNRARKKLEAVTPQRFIRWQEDHMPIIQDGPNAFRNSKIRSHLPVSVVERIASETVSKHDRKLLSRKQQHDAVIWGLNRVNFMSLKEWRKMADSSQLWTLLESIGCLAYQREY